MPKLANLHATATLALQAMPLPESGVPDGHLERINALQAAKGKPALALESIIARPIRLTGNLLTNYYTRFPDTELENFAAEINSSGAPMLSAHVTDETPMGTFYYAAVNNGAATLETGLPSGEKWLDTWAYWLATDDGIELAQEIDGGIIEEASIGFSYEKAICSITGADYFDSPYSRGEEYEITDVQTAQTTRRMCFIWLTGCSIREGSVCYRGAHPGTRVGGQFQAPAPQTAPSTYGFTLSVKDGQAFEKTRLKAEATPAPVENTVPAEKGALMPPRILLALGLVAAATETEILSSITQLQADRAAHQKALEGVLGLTGRSDAGEAFAVVTAWKASHDQLPAVVAERDTLSAAQTATQLEGIVARGQSEKKLTSEAQVAWARTQTPAALEAFLSVATPHPALSTKPAVQPEDALGASAKNPGTHGALSDDERLIVAQLGISEDKYLAHKAKLAAAN